MICGMNLFIHTQASTIEIWEWISDLIPYNAGHVVTFYAGIQVKSMLVKWVPPKLENSQHTIERVMSNKHTLTHSQ